MLFAMFITPVMAKTHSRHHHYHNHHHSHYHVYHRQNKRVVAKITENNVDISYYSDNVNDKASFFGNDNKQKTESNIFNFTAKKNDLINSASKYIGATSGKLGLPHSLWCADFMNLITHSGTDRTAKSYMHRGTPAPYGCVNCVAVTMRKGGGHVGVVSGYDSNGNPIMISGNHGNRVGVGVYAKSKVLAYRYVL